MTAWPTLPYRDWADTLDTVHMVVQILGKVRVALSPKEPEWAHITLYVSPRGLTTGPVPSPVGVVRGGGRLPRARRRGADRRRVATRPSRCVTGRSPSSGTSSSARCARSGSTPSCRRCRRRWPTRSRSPTTRSIMPTTPKPPPASGASLTVIEPVFAEYRAAFKGQGVAGPVLLGQRRSRGHPVLGTSRARRRRVPACWNASPTTASR